MTDFLDEEPTRRRRWPWVVGAAALVVAVIATVTIVGNANSGRSATASEGGPAGDPVQGGSLVYSETYPVTSFQAGNYSTLAVLSAVSDRLVFIPEGSSDVVPYLAKEWSVSDDGLRYHFTLRDGVTFSDGSELTSEDVVATIELQAFGDEQLGVPAVSTLADYVSSEIADDHEFTIVLSEPNSLFLRTLANPALGISSSENLELPYSEQKQFENFIGSGPFTIESSIPEQEIKLVKRDDYAWPPATAENQGAAYLDDVTIRFIEEPGLREGAVTSGQVDLARGIQPSDEQKTRDGGANTYPVTPAILTANLATIRIQDWQVSDVRVRQALQLGFDREELVDAVLSDSYEPATDYFASSDTASYHDVSDQLVADPDRAGALLDEAGWTERNAEGIRVKDGKTLTVTVSASAQSVAIKPALDFVADKWREIGVELVNLAGDTTAFDQSLKDYAGYPLYGSRSFIDAELSGFAGRHGYSDPTAERLIDDVLTATSDEGYSAATAAWSQYALFDGALAISLFEETHVFGASKDLHFAVDGHVLPQFAQIWKQ